jgi:B9 domain-containing protein 1
LSERTEEETDNVSSFFSLLSIPSVKYNLLNCVYRSDFFESSFAVQCLGQIESGQFENRDYLYCRYVFCYGSDWEVIGGIDNGLSQTSCQNTLTLDQNLIWNFPIDVTFKSTNISGWPRVAISVYGMDYFGRDIIEGYGSLLIPLKPGVHNLSVNMFKPVANSSLNQFLGWLSGNPPEVGSSLYYHLTHYQCRSLISSLTPGLSVKVKDEKSLESSPPELSLFLSL